MLCGLRLRFCCMHVGLGDCIVRLAGVLVVWANLSTLWCGLMVVCLLAVCVWFIDLLVFGFML